MFDLTAQYALCHQQCVVWWCCVHLLQSAATVCYVPHALSNAMQWPLNQPALLLRQVDDRDAQPGKVFAQFIDYEPEGVVHIAFDDPRLWKGALPGDVGGDCWVRVSPVRCVHC